MNEDHSRFKTFSRRAALLGGGKALLFGALAARLYYLQVVESDKYATLAEDNRISLRLLPPPRGRILDRFGIPLAANEQNYKVVLVAEQANDVERTLDRLGQVIELSADERARIMTEVRKKRAFVPVTVREYLDWQTVSRIEVNAPDLPGISIDVGQTRAYPFGKEMAHVLGYVAAVSEAELKAAEDPLLELPGFKIGKNGLEKEYDEKLRGTAGTTTVEVNAVGRTIRELKREEGTPGQDLVLSVDNQLQAYVQQRLAGEKSASVVLLDIATGGVLALGSVPSYDPNAFNLGISSSHWRQLLNDPLHPLTNKATAGLYNPGSTYKMVVALAALEAGIDPAEEVYCPGHYDLGNARFHCWKRWGHGKMDMHAAIKESCDVYFYDVSRRVGVDNIAAMSNKLGLGARTGLDLPGERGGTIPTKAWKRAQIGEPWQGGETLVTSIGQGFVLTSPLQLAVMTARIAGGHAVTPHFARDLQPRGDDDPTAQAVDAAQAMAARQGDPAEAAAATPAARAGLFPKLDIPEADLALIRDAMDAVVNERGGTAYSKRITREGWAMAGKTGTSQVRRITMAERRQGVVENEDLPWRRRDHGLYVAFAPVHAPRYACAVVVEHGGGGSSAAAPIGRDVLTEAQRLDPLANDSPRQIADAPSRTQGTGRMP
ncbi:penicillin-binding protein 2 [Rhodovibrio salinarum]|uniref:Penicillin-binding protein 2 n=1 Tax=Rhodovibrio salinarum TaxID=1087 RepID=A0A934UYG6_9PROT|nr:penicillin-binding protein 2 [Rhodovibrio salinarum]